ncbi:MAG: glycoside hydrolase family 25 [Clostridia bacterium]|nr:glycoside hydrolase family 25 [Clostridia bacterium]
MFKNRIIKINTPSKAQYPVRGVDVSRYQGDIDWPVLAGQDIRFAYIKATEGSTYIDQKFEYNFSQARQTDLRIGAYHFFSFDSGGDTQADNYIKNVEAFSGMLPPIVDVEYYGKYGHGAGKRPDNDAVVAELGVLLGWLEEHYGVKPVTYATGTAYKDFIRGNFDDYDIWIRDVYFRPGSGIKNWCFWQFSDKGLLEGYSGGEKYIDLDVWSGSIEEFENYGIK